MIDNSAEGFLPPERSLASLAKAVQGCQGCDLYLNATQAVFGEGSTHARAMLIGEQPGDREDVEGTSLRRAGRRGSRWRVTRNGDRSQRRLRDQRGQVLPVEGGATRQAPDPPETRSA